MNRTKVKKTLGRKVGWGKLALPIWGVALGVAVVAAAAGQAVGPVLSGSNNGSINLVVSQSVVLDTDYDIGANPDVSTSGAFDAVTTRNDEGTHFTLAMELHQGQNVSLKIYLQNNSGKPAASIMELNVPDGIDMELEEISDGVTGDSTVVDEAQMSHNTWLLNLTEEAGDDDAEGDDGVELTIEPKDDVRPGFYTITGRIVQTAG